MQRADAQGYARTDGRTYVELCYGGDQSFRSVPGAQKADFASILAGSASKTTNPNPETDPILARRPCRFCHRPVIWGRLVSGHHRAFEPELVAADQLADCDRYAVHRRYRAVVDLDGVANPPALVLAAHRCAEYAEAIRMRGLTSLGAVLDGGAA
jgi:hypothetical protein